MKRVLLVFLRAFWWAYIVRLSLRWIPGLNLGDVVVYKGKRYTLNQGVCRPLWDMGLIGGGEYLTHIHETEFRKERSLRNYMGSFRSGYCFYMTCWFSIWVNEGIKPWMRRCNIWPTKSGAA